MTVGPPEHVGPKAATLCLNSHVVNVSKFPTFCLKDVFLASLINAGNCNNKMIKYMFMNDYEFYCCCENSNKQKSLEFHNSEDQDHSRNAGLRSPSALQHSPSPGSLHTSCVPVVRNQVIDHRDR